MGGRASALVEIVICFGGVVRQGICESRFFLKLGAYLTGKLITLPRLHQTSHLLYNTITK
jgi:hypothetical protein